jgi:hypothetical protein
MASDIEEDDDENDVPLSDDGLEEFEGDAEAEEENLVVDSRMRAARTLEIRRAIESRLEERRLRQDLDYLETDEDDIEEDADLDD